MKHSTRFFTTTCILLCATTLPALGQNAGTNNFGSMSDGLNAPSTLLLKNLNSQWRRVLVDVGDNSANIYGGYGGMNSTLFRDALADLGIGVYFTKGQTVQLSNETYLLAYRIDRDYTQQELQDVYRTMYGGNRGTAETKTPAKFMADTKLVLSMLNMNTIKSMSEVRPFVASNEIMGAADVIEASNQNLKRLGAQLIQFNLRIRDYGVNVQQISDTNTLQRMMDRYIHTPASNFVNPATKEPYRFNRALLGKNLSRLSKKQRLVAFYEATPGTDGKRGTVFLGGQVERIPLAKWPSVVDAKVEGFSPQELQAVSARNLRQIGAQLRRQVRYRNGNLPVMADANTTRRALINYGGYEMRNAFTEPVTNQIYRPNPALSGKKLADIANPAQLVAFYEPKMAPDGTIGAVFLDGHVARVPQSQWNRVKAMSVEMKKSVRKI